MFHQDFCNPGRGNEKGNVESNNKHLKRRILSFLRLNKIKFTDLESFKIFVWDFCRNLNSKEKVKSMFVKENLKSLPPSDYPCYSTEIVKVNKYSMFSFGKYRHMYSAPSACVDMRMECRIYPEKIELIAEGEVICAHKRIYGLPGLVSINIEHIITALCKKPGAMKDWKYRKVLFERPIWKKFYEKIKLEKKENPDKQYLFCLKLMKKYNLENLTAAMDLVMEEGLEASGKSLEGILDGRCWDIETIKPIEINLSSYDELLKPKEKRYGNE